MGNLTGQAGQRPRTAPPARGHAAAAQEGEHSGTASNTRSNTGSSSHNAMVCMARAVHLEQAMSAQRIVNYNLNPSLRQPAPQPIPVLDMDFDGSQFLNTERFVTLALPVTAGQFSPIMENHIARLVIPGNYSGSLNPLEDDVWIFLHSHHLSDVDRTFAAITYPEGTEGTVIEEGVLPMLERRFGIRDRDCHNCIARFFWKIVAYLRHWFSHCWGHGGDRAPVTVTSRNNTLCITFYPEEHVRPILIQEREEVYIVPETALPGRWVDDPTHDPILPPWLANLDLSDNENSEEEKTDAGPNERAQMAISGPITALAHAVRKRDPTLAEIGEPCDLGNFLPDSGATQHMTP
jgi:hypothetical protein